MRRVIVIGIFTIGLGLVCQSAVCGSDQPSTGEAVEIDTLWNLTAEDSVTLEEIGVQIDNGEYVEAEMSSRKLLAKAEVEYGSESPQVAIILDQLVQTLWRQGKSREVESEEFAKRAVAIKEKSFGPEYQTLPLSLNNLGIIIYDQGRYEDAESLHKRALAIDEKTYGLDHQNVAIDLSNLAFLFHSLGRFDEAVQMYSRILAIFEKTLGVDHQRVGIVANNLAVIYFDLGKYAESEECYKRALAIKEKALGPDHHQVAASLNNLANLYWVQGRYDEAEPLHLRALAIREKNLGPDHPEVASSLGNLAVLYREQDRYVEAEPLFKRALAIDEKGYGPEHFQVAKDLNNLAIFYEDLGKYAEAERLHLRALAIREKVLGADHPDVASSLNNLANLYADQGRYADAEPLARRALAIWEQNLGANHSRVAKALNNLATLYFDQGRYTESEQLHIQALEIAESVLGSDHPDVAADLCNLANLYKKQGKYTEAEPLFERALAIDEKAFGSDHSQVAKDLNNLANLYMDQAKYIEAEQLHNRALAIKESVLGLNHPDVASSLNNLASLYRNQGRYAEAEPLFKRAIAIDMEKLGENHPQVAFFLIAYSQLLRLQGNHGQALELAARAVGIAQRNFNDNASVLSEKDALTFSQELRDAVSNYLSCYLEPGVPDSVTGAEVADVIFSTKGNVSDGIFERQRALVKETDSSTVALAESLRLVKFQLSQLFVEGPGEELQKYQRNVDSLGRLANELEADLSRHSASFRKHQDYQNISAERLARLLRGNSVLVEFLKFDYEQLKPAGAVPCYMAVVLNDNAEPHIVYFGNASDIEPLVSQYRSHMLEISSAGRMTTIIDQKEYQRISDGLYDKIWRPLEKYLVNKDMVFIAADGALNVVSFAGLLNDENKYLIEKFTVHYLSSGRDLIRIEDKAEPKSGLFALGDPDYDATAFDRLSIPEDTPPDSSTGPAQYSLRNVRSGCGKLNDIKVESLPGTRKEVAFISSAWRDATDELSVVYFGADASEEKLKTEAPGNRIIHIATHGYFLEGACRPDLPEYGFEAGIEFAGENPLLLSGLFFAGANLHGKGAETAGAEDGILTAYEVSTMALEGTALVVLSACETGLGQVKEGEGTYGLRRAFQMAGARTVVSALWSVPDETTAEMMGKLYLGTDNTIPERIRDLQLERISALRAENKPDHPFSWGAFIAIGDWK
ncbi:MAG: tetratricopeptide repeat protein [candidate division Zixibacteria bacterium]|nr:tetratricopeptide repeat protein [candidate division Zixibacteria bacterium]